MVRPRLARSVAPVYSLLVLATASALFESREVLVDRLHERDERVLRARPLAVPPRLVVVLARVAPDAQLLHTIVRAIAQPARVAPEADTRGEVGGRLGGARNVDGVEPAHRISEREACRGA